MTSPAFTIRPPVPADLPRLVALCEQLGYPSTPVQVQQRLDEICSQADQAVFVAVLADGTAAGWAHAQRCLFLESDAFVELVGLVVDEHCRGMGLGGSLLAAVEAWSLRQGIAVVRLRSNVIRTEAHAFYRRAGYTQVKTQAAFEKRLG